MKAFKLIKRFFTEKFELNVPVLLICFAISCFIYHVYKSQTLQEKSFSVRLKVESKNGMIPAGAYKEQIQVIVKGSLDDIASISAYDFNAYLDLNYVSTEGVHDFPVLLRLSDEAMSKVSLQTKCNPSHLKLSVEEEDKKYVDVEPLLFGKVADGFELKSVKVEPSQILITGPKSRIQEKTLIKTNQVSIDNASTDFEYDATIGENLLYLKPSTKNVKVKCEIVPVKATRKIDLVKVNLVNISDKLELKSNTENISITIYGNKNEIEKYVPSTNTVIADCSKIKTGGRFDVPISINIPSRFSLTGEVVKKISATFNLKPVVDENKIEASKEENKIETKEKTSEVVQ